jgi:serine/threonine-protein kinase BUR1
MKRGYCPKWTATKQIDLFSFPHVRTLLMVRTPPKRTASHSPDNGRPYKRFATSSPEEGEVDDDEETLVPHASLHVLPPRPVSPRPPLKFEPKVKFPFKKKNGIEQSSPPEPEMREKTKQPVAVIYERSEEDERKIREKELQRKWPSHSDPSRRIPHTSKSGTVDHWDPSLDYASKDRDRGRLPGSGWQNDQSTSSRQRRSAAAPSEWNFYSSRSRARSSPSPSRSTSSSTSTRRGKHRLPSHRDRSPVYQYSPPQRDYGVDRIRDKQRERDDAWDRDHDSDKRQHDDDHRRRDDRYYPPRDDRGYNLDHDGRYWRPGVSPPRQDYTRRDDYDYRDLYEGARRRGMDSYRPSSPGPSARTISSSAYPPRSPSLPHTADGPQTPPPPLEPPPPPPPPIDLKDDTLPISHPAVSIPLPMRRPAAPMDVHSPTPLPLPPAEESAVKREQERKDSEGHVREVFEIKKRLPVRRSRKEEYAAYGRSFEGCGMQGDYDVTTKLGEGTFGRV